MDSVNRSLVSWSRMVIIPLYSALFRLQFLAIQCWNLHSSASSGEGHQDSQGWSTCPVSRGWRKLGLFSLGKRQLAGVGWGELAAAPTVQKEGIKKMEPRSFMYERHQTWNKRLRLNIRRNFFPMRTVGHWNRLLREVAQPLSWEGFKPQLDKTLRNLIRSHSWPCFEQVVALEICWGPFQPECFCGPMICWVLTEYLRTSEMHFAAS